MRIHITKLKKYYGERQVLDIDDLIFEEHKITAITGPNGCGKTTLLNIIAGLDKDYKGEIRYNGFHLNKDITDKMTLVFQKPYLFKRSVYENIEYPLKIRGLSKDIRNKKILDIVKKLEIEDLLEKRAHLLSGGESQKVALARALVFEPDLLLLDEPTSNIDPDAVAILEREIIRFNEESKGTVIIVTHNLEQSKRLGHRIVEM